MRRRSVDQYGRTLTKMRLVTQPHDPQHGGHGPLSGREDRADNQDLNRGPQAFRKERRKNSQYAKIAQQAGSASVILSAKRYPSTLLSRLTQMDKVQISKASNNPPVFTR